MASNYNRNRFSEEADIKDIRWIWVTLKLRLLDVDTKRRGTEGS